MKASLLTELFDTIAPRRCAVCGQRLAPEETLVCVACDMRIEETRFWLSPRDNTMTRLFWGQFPIEKASAWFYFHPHSAPGKMIYDLKYHGQPLLGEDIGEQMGLRHRQHHFFDDIDAIVPMPITRRRAWHRGYNQSEMIARGLSTATRLPVYRDVIKRTLFAASQTHQSAWERRENVENVFQLRDAERIRGKHLLIVDDVVTTGATVIACAKEMAKADSIKISILSVGFTKS